jgi:RNA polymerase sigma-70 factor (ECF subfamily)
MRAEMAVEIDSNACGEPIAVDVLFRAHAAFVASFLRHMGTSESDLDDFVQDVFITAHRKGGYLPGPASPRTWLASLAFRVLLARRRARARRPESAMPHENLADSARGPADVLEARRALERVRTALEHLSLEHRAAFILHDIDGESCESIAATWDIPVGTVYSRLHHARKRFTEAYGRSTSRERSSGGVR